MYFNLPVVMYHSISNWKSNLALTPHLFEAQCKALAENNWYCVSLEEAEAYFIQGKKPPQKSVWLTFDDGYLDNYINAYPILKKYNLKGTVFVVTEKVEKEITLRPTLEKVWQGEINITDLPPINEPFQQHELGFIERQDLFMNWEEIKFLNKTGTMQIAAHSLRHDKIFCSSEYTDFYFPKARTRTFDRLYEEILWGMPMFAAKPFLSAKAFIPSDLLLNFIKSTVPQNKKAAFDFAADPQKMTAYKNSIASLHSEELGRMETEKEMLVRLKHEFKINKEILEEKLGKPVKTFCWPWGEYNQEALNVGKKEGFAMFVTIKAGSNKTKKPNHIARFSIKRRSPEQLLRRLTLLRSSLFAGLYARLRFRGKFW